MLIKAGVDISRLNRQIRRALRFVSDIFEGHGQEVIVTSTFEGNHGSGSLHYADDAIDIRHPSPVIYGIIDKIRTSVGPDFDVVDRTDHVHIEYDP